MLRRLLDKTFKLWQGRFLFGASFVLGSCGINRYTNGSFRVHVTVAQLLSVATGHWPASLFDFAYISGERSCFHLVIMGCMIGTVWVPDIKINEDETVDLLGPDYRKVYTTFSFINHKNKNLQEII